jgi:hypothetical protein
MQRFEYLRYLQEALDVLVSPKLFWKSEIWRGERSFRSGKLCTEALDLS